MGKITNNIIGDKMRKKIIVMLVIIILIIIFFPKESKEFRIRVVANSDSISDQNMKMVVVEAINICISSFEKENIINEIKTNLDKIDQIVKSKLGNNDYTISIKRTSFPAKEVGGTIIPGGRYQTLLIVLGAGEGKNWWSLLYPEYHGIYFEDIESDDVEYRFYLWDKIKQLLFCL